MRPAQWIVMGILLSACDNPTSLSSDPGKSNPILVEDQQEDAKIVEDESVIPPVNVHGAYLACTNTSFANDDGLVKQDVGCALVDESKRKLALAELGEEFIWTHDAAELQIDINTSPEDERFHVVYSAQAGSYQSLQLGLSIVSFRVDFRKGDEWITIIEAPDSPRKIAEDNPTFLAPIEFQGWKQANQVEERAALKVLDETVCRTNDPNTGVSGMGRVENGNCRVATGRGNGLLPYAFQNSTYELYLDPAGQYKSLFGLIPLTELDKENHYSINQDLGSDLGCVITIQGQTYFGETWVPRDVMSCAVNASGAAIEVVTSNFLILDFI
ncbi:hypothetical protein [Pseudobacteriovorax antillogorgiicola]|uniref:Uncharacterized protein n=1 Tax=Pseudobacteriovorax antillogorgiicola TaxID=1513793 RepID=A0A1Y6C3Q7_9BACT|nr:hypothetical protein [Pseudobacteriovorax antillogorgiicola]TCS49858.1 hypothetical protein EDD56_114103 [Pseudobacteriovorax antillogorgiicola]SMF43769.1 hypothetical protein SAMN06296036_113102 [Pseudobacteriovorax antillogorgiicola]